MSLDQKNLLEQYINNVSNKKTLAEFVNKKANVLHKGLVAERKKVEDKINKEKTKGKAIYYNPFEDTFRSE